MRFERVRQAAVVTAVVLGTGALANWWSAPLWERLQRNVPALNLRAVEGGLGRGLTLGLFGGFRAIIADFLWLAQNLAWEKQDLSESVRLLELTTAVDPRPLYFWINGARIIAYDMPVWREEASPGNTSAQARARIDREQAELALNYLGSARRFHPDSPLVPLEMGNIHLNRLGAIEIAAEYYRRAALMPGAPRYAARIYGELLKRQGRFAEALAWLKRIHPTLDPANPNDLADVVLHRIRELEDQLEVPPEQRYATGSSANQK